VRFGHDAQRVAELGLRAAAAGTVTGIEETSLRALTKLEQTLPARLRYRLDALRQATVSAAGGGPTVDAETLASIAGACRDHERLPFDYLGRDGESGVRHVEPHRLVYTGRRWYLLAWDRDRAWAAWWLLRARHSQRRQSLTTIDVDDARRYPLPGPPPLMTCPGLRGPNVEPVGCSLMVGRGGECRPRPGARLASTKGSVGVAPGKPRKTVRSVARVKEPLAVVLSGR
jgi:WYL domain